YINIAWGTFSFRGRLKSINEEYSLFSPFGIPLRVNLDLTFVSHMEKEEANKEEGKESPDLSRMIILKAGESIALWCCRIYGDASYCADVAAWNGLPEFRNIKPGVALLFPPLSRYGKFTR
ncbi:MAG: hypothetical protein LIP01_14265, partial [Tannerellaceae bacterium]|nr:hypothetical protein [Tannerellaceae bacterium]